MTCFSDITEAVYLQNVLHKNVYIHVTGLYTHRLLVYKGVLSIRPIFTF